MYSHVSLNKLQLNIASPEGSELKLNKGEILKGQVKDVKDNGLILIYLKGRLIEALSEVMVKPGDMLYLMVEDFRDRKAYLKVLTSESLGRMENDALALRLKEIGISPREEDILIAKKLIQYHLPLTQENVRKISAGVRIMGEFNDKNLEIAAFALAKGIPINKQNLDLIRYLVDKNTDLAKLADAIMKFIDQYTGKNTHLTGNIYNEAGLKESGQAGITKGEIIKEAIKVEENIKESLNQDLKNIKIDDRPGGTAGIGVAKDITDVKTNLPLFMGNNSQDIASGFKLPKKSLHLMQLLKAVWEEVRLDPSVVKDNNVMAVKIKEILTAEKDFSRVLARVLEILNKEEAFKGNRVGLEFLRNLDNVEKEINGYRLFNFISRSSSDNNFNYYYFAWPVKVDDNTHLLEMRINREKSPGSIRDADSLSIAVALETPKMGKVLFHVNWNRTYKIELRGVVETPSIREYIEKNVYELVNALAGLGYKVDFLGIKVAENREEIMLNQIRLAKADETVRPFGIDVIV